MYEFLIHTVLISVLATVDGAQIQTGVPARRQSNVMLWAAAKLIKDPKDKHQYQFGFTLFRRSFSPKACCQTALLKAKLKPVSMLSSKQQDS